MVRRLIVQGLRFALVVVAVYFLVFFALCRIPFQGRPLIFRMTPYYQCKGGITWLKFHEFNAAARWDAIVIGSSHAYRGYDPRLFAARGIHMFNLGSSAQTPMNTFFLLKDMVTPNNCDLVIMDLFENTFEEPGLESTNELTQDVISNRTAVEMAAALHELRSVNLLALRFCTRDTSLYGDSTYVSGGFAECDDSLRTVPHYDMGRPWRPNADQINYFGRCIRYCAQQHIPLILVSHYYPHASDHARHAVFHAFVDSVIVGTNVRYLDLSYAHHADDLNNFYDHNHLNSSGVALFNAQLIDSLQARGQVPPH